MMGMLMDKNKITGSIMEKVLSDGKSEHKGPKEFPEGCKVAALELLKAVEAKDANGIIAAFIALSQETESYEG